MKPSHLYAACVLMSIACTALIGCAGKPPVPPDYVAMSSAGPCISRVGRCFDARIGDHWATPLATLARHKELTQIARTANKDFYGEIHWEIAQPVSGAQALKVKVQPNALGGPGSHGNEPASTHVYALDGELELEAAELETDNSVRIGGSPVLKEVSRVKGFPPGRYVFQINLSTGQGRDRKNVFVTVQ